MSASTMRQFFATAFLLTAGFGAVQAETPSAQTPMVSPLEAANAAYSGRTVLWGGHIVARVNGSDGVPCMEVVSYPLNRSTGQPEMPREHIQWGGQHFLACGTTIGTNDYAVGRMTTVAGTLGATQERVGNNGCMLYPYPNTFAQPMSSGCLFRLPVVAASDIQTWPDVATSHREASIVARIWKPKSVN